MSTSPTPAVISTAIRRFAHVAGSAQAIVEFHDRSIYCIEPFRDDDWVALMKLQVCPGLYFNHILRTRENYCAVKLPSWPEVGSQQSMQVYYWALPVSA